MIAKRVLAVALGMSLTGCIYGYVDDAVTGSAIQGVTVTVVKGNCSGSGCTNPNIRVTDSSGLWVFDAYGNHNGSGDVQYITPAAGEEAVTLSFSKAGYKTVTYYHRPKYHSMQDPNDGQYYQVSDVPPVYLCATNAVDTDGDGICDAAEAQYGTSPTNSDTDGDRISDLAELYGWGGVDLRYFGANPNHKDLFIEADYYPNRMPTSTGIQRVVDAFANAPVTNPDGVGGIALHVDLSDQIASADADPDLNPAWTDFDVIKNKYFPARRAPFFHYVLYANTYNGGSSSGLSRGIPAHDFMVTLGAWPVPGGTELQQAGTLMHEFGHNLGLQHGGNEGLNYKANYLSLMSYNYQVNGLVVNGVSEVLDYSRLRIASISEASANETTAFAPIAPTTEAILATYTGIRLCGSVRTGNASANLDFNGNGVIQGTIGVDLDCDSDTLDTLQASQNDWLALMFDGAGSIGDPNLGISLGLKRLEPFTVTPEKAPSCMTPADVK